MNCIIDKLTLCYRIVDSAALSELILNKDEDRPTEIRFDDSFSMHLTKKKGFKSAFNIIYADIDDTGSIQSNAVPQMKNYLFGVIKFGQLNDDENIGVDNLIHKKVWLDIENSSFYFRYNHKANKLVYLDYITKELGLELNNVTHLDIALDSQINFARSVKDLIRCKELTPIVVNKAYEDRSKLIPHIQFIYSTTPDRLLNYSIYIQQKGSDNISVKCYNKNIELENNSDKEYISEYYKYPAKLNRLEVRLHRKQVHKFFEDNNIELKTDYFWVDNNEILKQMLDFYLNKLLRFRKTKYDKNPMGLLEAISWLDKRKKEIRKQKRIEKIRLENL